MLKRLIISVFILSLTLISAQAQDSTNQIPQPPCSAPEFKQFDFWVGSWDLTWSDSLHGTNNITKDFDNCVITEHFDSQPSGNFKGMSVSTYSKNLGKWQQTWVDNQGGYLDFIGGWETDRMVLSRSFMKNDSTVFQRMVWFDISDSSFTWNWERSTDNENWATLWQIHYKRKQ